VGANHTNTSPSNDVPDTVDSAVYVFDIPSDPRQRWPRTQISKGITPLPNAGGGMRLAPGVFGWGDLDGDGDIDIALSGDGDPRTYWMEQTAPGTFVMHVIEEKLGQAGGAQIVDVTGDGKNDLVFVGYEDSVVNLYMRSR
jgi:hypothetical protein